MQSYYLTQRSLRYRVRHICGHLERRMMREATAGIPWTETAEVPAGNRCQHCTSDDRGHAQHGTPCTLPSCQVIPDADLTKAEA